MNEKFHTTKYVVQLTSLFSVPNIFTKMIFKIHTLGVTQGDLSAKMRELKLLRDEKNIYK